MHLPTITAAVPSAAVAEAKAHTSIVTQTSYHVEDAVPPTAARPIETETVNAPTDVMLPDKAIATLKFQYPNPKPNEVVSSTLFVALPLSSDEDVVQIVKHVLEHLVPKVRNRLIKAAEISNDPSFGGYGSLPPILHLMRSGGDTARAKVTPQLLSPVQLAEMLRVDPPVSQVLEFLVATDSSDHLIVHPGCTPRVKQPQIAQVAQIAGDPPPLGLVLSDKSTLASVPQVPELAQQMRTISCYNAASQRVLVTAAHARSTPSSLTNAEEKCPTAAASLEALSLRQRPVVASIMEMQRELRQGTLNIDEYRANVERLLCNEIAVSSSESFNSTRQTDKLADEVAHLYPQLYAGMDSRDPVAQDPQSILHRHLHTLHVLPVIRSLQQRALKVPIGGFGTAAAGSDAGINGTSGQYARATYTEVCTWRAFATAVTVACEEHPLQFGPYLIALLSCLYSPLYFELKPLLDARKHIPLLELDSQYATLVSDAARVLCAILKDQRTPWAIGADQHSRSLIEVARRQAKMIFHKPHSVTTKAVDRVWSALIDILQAPQVSRDTLRVFMRKLLHKLSIAHTFDINGMVQLVASEIEKDKLAKNDPPAVSIPLHTSDLICVECGEAMEQLSLVRLHPLLECLHPECFLNSDPERVQGFAPVLWSLSHTVEPIHRLNGSRSASFASSHLMAHHKNVIESVIGTRATVLPDSRHATMSARVTGVQTLERNPHVTASMEPSLPRISVESPCSDDGHQRSFEREDSWSPAQRPRITEPQSGSTVNAQQSSISGQSVIVAQSSAQEVHDHSSDSSVESDSESHIPRPELRHSRGAVAPESARLVTISENIMPILAATENSQGDAAAESLSAASTSDQGMPALGDTPPPQPSATPAIIFFHEKHEPNVAETVTAFLGREPSDSKGCGTDEQPVADIVLASQAAKVDDKVRTNAEPSIAVFQRAPEPQCEIETDEVALPLISDTKEPTTKQKPLATKTMAPLRETKPAAEPVAGDSTQLCTAANAAANPASQASETDLKNKSEDAGRCLLPAARKPGSVTEVPARDIPVLPCKMEPSDAPVASSRSKKFATRSSEAPANTVAADPAWSTIPNEPEFDETAVSTDMREAVQPANQAETVPPGRTKMEETSAAGSPTASMAGNAVPDSSAFNSPCSSQTSAMSDVEKSDTKQHAFVAIGEKTKSVLEQSGVRGVTGPVSVNPPTEKSGKKSTWSKPLRVPTAASGAAKVAEAFTGADHTRVITNEHLDKSSPNASSSISLEAAPAWVTEDVLGRVFRGKDASTGSSTEGWDDLDGVKLREGGSLPTPAWDRSCFIEGMLGKSGFNFTSVDSTLEDLEENEEHETTRSVEPQGSTRCPTFAAPLQQTAARNPKGKTRHGGTPRATGLCDHGTSAATLTGDSASQRRNLRDRAASLMPYISPREAAPWRHAAVGSSSRATLTPRRAVDASNPKIPGSPTNRDQPATCVAVEPTVGSLRQWGGKANSSQSPQGSFTKSGVRSIGVTASRLEPNAPRIIPGPPAQQTDLPKSPRQASPVSSRHQRSNRVLSLTAVAPVATRATVGGPMSSLAAARPATAVSLGQSATSIGAAIPKRRAAAQAEPGRLTQSCRPQLHGNINTQGRSRPGGSAATVATSGAGSDEQSSIGVSTPSFAAPLTHRTRRH